MPRSEPFTGASLVRAKTPSRSESPLAAINRLQGVLWSEFDLHSRVLHSEISESVWRGSPAMKFKSNKTKCTCQNMILQLHKKRLPHYSAPTYSATFWPSELCAVAHLCPAVVDSSNSHVVLKFKVTTACSWIRESLWVALCSILTC